MRTRFQRHRQWLALAGVILVAAVVLPPGATEARRYVFAQAVQFGVLAIAAPALLVLGAPWRLVAGTRGGARAGAAGLVDRIAAARSHRPGAARPWLITAVFAAVALGWRAPSAIDAAARHPAVLAAEAVTLLAAGCALWLELVESPPFLPRAGRPQRAACAAVPMWAIWADAYVMGFSSTSWLAAYPHPAGGLGVIADQEIATFLLWAISGLCFVPVVFVALLTWMRDGAYPEGERPGAPSAPAPAAAGAPPLRPPKGWRIPQARQQGARR